MTKKLIAVAAVVAVSALSGYWYFSPYLALHSMKSAAQAKDADSFNNYVDYPHLRDSIKGQFSAYMAQQVGQGAASSEAERAGMALGSMLAMALADKFVDAMVRPEMVMHAMASGEFKPVASTNNSASASRGVEPDWTMDRKGIDKVLVRVADVEPDTEGFALVFERSGFASWKLTEVRLPVDGLRK